MNSIPSFNSERMTRSSGWRSRGVRASLLGTTLLLLGLVGTQEPEGERLSRRMAEMSKYSVTAAQAAQMRCTTARQRAKAIQAYFSGNRDYTNATREWTRKRQARLTLMTFSFAGAIAFMVQGLRSSGIPDWWTARRHREHLAR